MNSLSAIRSIHRREEGSVLFSSVFLVIGMAFLIGYIGNMWSEIIERQNSQNAADAAAYSASVWHARGMNTVCTCNHLMGELTSLAVVLEALGGPEAGEKPFEPTSTDQVLNSVIQGTSGLAKSMSDLAPFARFDGKFVDLLVRIFVKSHTRHYCGAAIYDAELALKQLLASGLMAKCVGTVLEIIGKIPPLKAVGIVGTAIHGLVDLSLGLELFPEIIKLRILETLVSAIAPIKDIVRVIVPVLGTFSAEIAGIGITEGAIRTAIQDTSDRVCEFYGLKSCVIVPGHLPVQRESAPSSSGGRQPLETPWQSDDSSSSFAGMITSVMTKLAPARLIIDAYYHTAKATPSRLRSRNQKKVIREYPKISKYASQMKQGIPGKGYPDNPSRARLKSFDLAAETLTQFVRGTHPYVDSVRSPMRGWFRSEMPISNISTYFTHWTYRYTLNESYCMRSGEYGIPASMLVLEGWTPKKKGAESWTEQPKEADRMFSVCAAVLTQPRKPIFSPEFYSRSREKGDVAVAQGMIYNLNGRDPKVDSSGKNRQPSTGWDTLQWEPQGGFIRALEWNAQPSGRKGQLAPWGFFNTRSLSPGDGARVKLNWQAKLRPATGDGARQISREPDIPPEIRSICEVLSEHPDVLIH